MYVKLIQPKMIKRPMDTDLKTHMSPPLGLLTVMSVLRKEHRVMLENENIRPVQFLDGPDIVGISVTVDTLPRAIEIARENARRAGVSAYLKVFEADVRTITKPDRRGTIVCNPPYGERLMTPEAVEELYRDMGRCFAGFEPWQIYVLTSHEGFEQLYGRRADKIRRLYNGMIPCSFYQFFRPQMPKKGR